MKITTKKTKTTRDGGQVFTATVRLTKADVEALRRSDIACELVEKGRNVIATIIRESLDFQLTNDMEGGR